MVGSGVGLSRTTIGRPVSARLGFSVVGRLFDGLAEGEEVG